MILSTLKLINFRNYENLDIKFSSGINFLIGDNASGKTNLLESVYYLSFGRSFKNNSDEEVIKFNKENAIISALLEDEDKNLNIKICLNKNGKIIEINSTKVKKTSELLSYFNALIFTPKDVSIFKENPRVRRFYLDSNISKISSNYRNNLGKYNKILKERNNELKKEKVNYNLIDVLTLELIKVSKEIYLYRKKFINKLNEVINEIYLNIDGNKDVISVKYLAFIDDFNNYENKLLESYKRDLSLDLERKITNNGVHKEDFKVYLNDKDISLYGSQGQNRMCAISLKLSPYFLSKEDNRPIVLLDDVLNELDKKHEDLLLNYLTNFKQVFITTTKKENYFSGKIYFINKDQTISEE